MITDVNVKAANKAKIETIIKNLERRNMKGFYADDAEEAKKIVMDLIPEGSVVGRGGSQTLIDLGIVDAVKEGNYEYIDAFLPDPDAAYANKRKVLLSDVFLTSTNAITYDGELVNIDGRGNRVAALIFGPDKVIVVTGANKIVTDVDSAVKRIKTDACGPNCTRLGRKSPCAVTGRCGNCVSADSTICCHTVVTRTSMIKDRIYVVLVNDNLGY